MAKWSEQHKKGKRRAARFCRRRLIVAGDQVAETIVCNADTGPGNGTGLRDTGRV